MANSSESGLTIQEPVSKTIMKNIILTSENLKTTLTNWKIKNNIKTNKTNMGGKLKNLKEQIIAIN